MAKSAESFNKTLFFQYLEAREAAYKTPVSRVQFNALLAQLREISDQGADADQAIKTAIKGGDKGPFLKFWTLPQRKAAIETVEL